MEELREQFRKTLIENPETFQELMDFYYQIQCRYQSAIQEVQTKLQILDNEFKAKYSRNPIHQMQSRLKSFPSIIEKLQRRSYPMTIASVTENLTDIAGIRVICSYVSDVYNVAQLLTNQDDVRIIKFRDYIVEPKPNGYRSLHLVVEIPVFLSEGKVLVPVEVQFRTIAMDCWASLEHNLRYKGLTDVSDEVNTELKALADQAGEMDRRFQKVYELVNELVNESYRTENTKCTSGDLPLGQ